MEINVIDIVKIVIVIPLVVCMIVFLFRLIKLMNSEINGEKNKDKCEPVSESKDIHEFAIVEKKKSDAVKHPSHYCYSKYEPKDVIHEWGLNFNLGSAVKYIARAGRKDDILQDLEKAKQFLDFEISEIKKERRKK